MTNKLAIRTAFMLSMVAGSLVALAAAAGATTVDPVATTQGVLDSGVNSIEPIIVAVVTTMLGILVLVVGVRLGWNALKRPGKSPVK